MRSLFFLYILPTVASQARFIKEDSFIASIEQGPNIFCDDKNLSEEEHYAESCDLLLNLLHSFQYLDEPFTKIVFPSKRRKRASSKTKGLMQKVINFLKSDVSNFTKISEEFNRTALYTDDTLLIIKNAKNEGKREEDVDTKHKPAYENAYVPNSIETPVLNDDSLKKFNDNKFDAVLKPKTLKNESFVTSVDDIVGEKPVDGSAKEEGSLATLWAPVEKAITTSIKTISPKMTSHEFGKKYYKLKQDHIKSSFVSKLNIDAAPPFFPKTAEDMTEEKRREVCDFLTNAAQLQRRCCNAIRAICPQRYHSPTLPPPTTTTVSPIQHLVNLQAISNVASFVSQLIFGRTNILG